MEVMDQPPVPVVRPKPKRLRYIVAGGLCAAAVLFLVVGGLSRNIVYFRTVSEAVRAHDKAPADGARLRMAGAVVTGSVVRSESAPITDQTSGLWPCWSFQGW